MIEADSAHITGALKGMNFLRQVTGSLENLRQASAIESCICSNHMYTGTFALFLFW